MTRLQGIAVLLCLPFGLLAQGGDKELRASADALFAKGEYAAAFQPYQTLVGNNQQDFDLNFRYGVCALHSAVDKDEAIKYLKRSTLGPATDPLAWYFLGKAYHLSYQFKEALVAYERYRGTADKKLLSEHPVDALELQCRNGQNLLSNLKEIDVHNKMEVAGTDFFRFYDLGSIGGRIVVTPDELKSSLDRKSKDLALVYLPDKGGPIYFASYGKGGDTGRDIYRTELLPTGEFATPTKLAGYINTAQDEDFPFMAPDGKSFYFCSKGHNSMGGYDVFKSTFDKGLDVFGAPVNMDFAVNTPDDDVLYLTDPEGKEACFASGRDSKQGMLHVYRVSTAQAPVNITVLKGTFASQLNAEDRKAHIVVQDALTQEQVADVRTDQNGGYVLSLPRSGKYRFLVEAGPEGRTHMGVVDVPRNDEPRAYRQEMTLVEQGGEKLMIRNYFDAPLEEDMIALALDEIKRRAKLDVGTRAVVAEEKPVEQPQGDPLTRAGFAGDVSRTSAQRMASDDAAQLTQEAEGLEQQSVAAFSLALDNANLADKHTARAEELVAQASAEADEARKNSLMMDAARERQNARAASDRAIAALRAGEELAQERRATQLRADKATRLNADLTRVLSGTDENAMVIKLVELRMRMDEKNAPDGTITPAEKMRRMATEQEKEAASTLARANAARGEENELVDRIARKKREEDEAKGNKKENLARERNELENQLQAMREENERAFAKAQTAERETAHARGQAALARHLATAAAGMTVNELTEDQRGQLTQRINGMGSRIAAIAVDERYDAAIAMEAREIERRTYDWGAPLDGGAETAIATTTTMPRDSSATAQHMERTATMAANPDLQPGQVSRGATAEQPAALTGAETGNASTATNTNADAAPGTVTPEQAVADARPDGTTPSGETAAPLSTMGSEPVGVSRTDTDLASMKGAVTDLAEPETDTATANEVRTSGTEEGAINESGAEVPSPEELAFVQANELAELKQVRAAEKRRAQRDSLDQRIAELEREMRESAMSTADATATPGGNAQPATTSATSATGTENGSTDARPVGAHDQPSTTGTNTGTSSEAPSTGTRTSTTSTGSERPATALAITPVGAEDRSATTTTEVDPAATGSADAAANGTAINGPALEFDANTSDAQLLADIYPDYAASKARIEREADDPKERSAALHGLELMLVDSIDAENLRQLDHLERHPEAPAPVLARVDRLRRMKEDHVAEAERALSAAQQEYAAGETRAVEDAVLAGNDAARTGSERSIPASATPHNDDYVNIADDREQVYTSTMDHRTAKAAEAIRERDRDVATLVEMEDRIDSLEEVLESMPFGREQEKLRDKTDRLIDDHMILRTEIGQRMGYISRQEFAAAQDSAKELVALNAKLDLPANEPLVLLARSLEETALGDMDAAKRMRTQADRTEDIVLRDSLFRSAYVKELEALRAMDRSHTVRNHIQSAGYVRGEQLTYEEVERRMFRADDEQPLAGNAAPAGTQASGDGGEVVVDADVNAPTTPPGTDAATSANNTAQPAATLPPIGDRYKEFMAAENSGAMSDLPASDVSVLRSEARQAADRSQALEQASIAAADRANALQDSAGTARRSERERLEREALRNRAISDSLHAASVQAGDLAAELEQRAGQAQEASAFQERLRKYYYLSSEDNGLVMNEEDRSRYFQARAKALDQREQALHDQEQAVASKQLADTLLQQSKLILSNPNAGGAPLTPEQMDQARLLTDRAVLLAHQADSLNRSSERLKMAAGVNESQAASMLQALTPERGTEIMAMEQRTRRVEPLLAEARSLQGADPRTAAAASVPAVTEQTPASTPPAAGTARTNEQPAATTANVVPSSDVNTTTDAAVARPTPAEPASSATTTAAERPAGATPEAAAPRLLAPLTADVFELGSGARTGPILMDQPMPAGVVYKVQIGAFRQEIPQELFSDLSPVTGETVGNGLTRYSVGMFTSPEGALEATRTVRERGYRDAFVVAYQDGRRVSLTQAMRAARPVAASTAAVAELPTTPAARITPVPVAAPVTTSDSAVAAEQAVLANYPASAEEVLAQFAPPADATAYYNVPGAAPARQVETVKGLFFTVQVGVYSKPTALDRLFNITPLNSERTENAKIRYTTGVFVEMDKARARKDEAVTLGVRDAFITAYLNGKRIPMRDARALINKFGAAVFADPSVITR